jgi:Immunity protein 40
VQPAVLGGDILSGSGGTLSPTHDTWSCDIQIAEPWSDYVIRSCAHAARYLETLKKRPELWFTLVASARPNAAQLAKSYDR